MFRVCEMTADLCIRKRIYPPRAPNSSFKASSTSLDHPPRTSMMMLCCRVSLISWELLTEFPAEGAILSGLLFLLLFSALRPRDAHFYRQKSLLLVIYKSRIPSVLPHLLTYCKDWNVPDCLGLGWFVFGFGNDRRPKIIIKQILLKHF